MPSATGRTPTPTSQVSEPPASQRQAIALRRSATLVAAVNNEIAAVSGGDDARHRADDHGGSAADKRGDEPHRTDAGGGGQRYPGVTPAYQCRLPIGVDSSRCCSIPYSLRSRCRCRRVILRVRNATWSVCAVPPV